MKGKEQMSQKKPTIKKSSTKKTSVKKITSKKIDVIPDETIKHSITLNLFNLINN